MKILYPIFICLILFSKTSWSQFSGGYSPSKWTTTLSPGSNGTINIATAPASITITGSDGPNGTNVDTRYTITAAASGIWSFNWSYHTNDADADASYDPAGVWINGVFTQLTNNSGGVDQSGSYSGAFVSAGTEIGFIIRATDNVMGTATLTISSFSPPGGVLPLSLSSFIAKKQGREVNLQWTTVNEINASHFEVERSVNGNDFMNIHQVPAQNMDNQQYSFVDKNPETGMNHYRLRMVDQDGSFSYSEIESVQFKHSSDAYVFPNPVKGNCSVMINMEKPAQETIQLFDAGGRLIMTRNLNMVQGINSIPLNLSFLTKGIYFIKTQTTGFSWSVVKE